MCVPYSDGDTGSMHAFDVAAVERCV